MPPRSSPTKLQSRLVVTATVSQVGANDRMVELAGEHSSERAPSRVEHVTRGALSRAAGSQGRVKIAQRPGQRPSARPERLRFRDRRALSLGRVLVANAKGAPHALARGLPQPGGQPGAETVTVRVPPAPPAEPA